MPTSLLRPEKSKIADLEAHLKWRERNLGRLLGGVLGSMVACLACWLPTTSHKSLFFPAFLPIAGGVFLGVAGVFFVTIAMSFGATDREVGLLLESDSVEVVPALAAYHLHFTTGGHTIEKANTVRTRILQLLHAQSETPLPEFTSYRLYCLIDLIPRAETQEDRRFLLEVVAQAGTPACFAALDSAVWKICVSELRKDERAQHALRSMVNECKVAIRARDNKAQVGQTLLRASDGTHGLLHPSSPPRPASDVDNLLHATVKPEE